MHSFHSLRSWELYGLTCGGHSEIFFLLSHCLLKDLPERKGWRGFSGSFAGSGLCGVYVRLYYSTLRPLLNRHTNQNVTGIPLAHPQATVKQHPSLLLPSTTLHPESRGSAEGSGQAIISTLLWSSLTNQSSPTKLPVRRARVLMRVFSYWIK